MDLLPWFRRIPGQEINVRLPFAPSTPKIIIDTVETDTFTLSILETRTYNAYAALSNISIPITQGILSEAVKGIPSKRIREYATPAWMYSGPTTHQTLFTEADVYYSDLAYELEIERQRQTEYSVGWSWQWGYTDETLPQIVYYV